LELARREASEPRQELDVALEELQRIDRIVDHLLLLATADQPDFLSLEEIDLEPFLEDVFMRWCESRRGPGGSRSVPRARCGRIRSACGPRSTRCLRTRSSTPSRTRRSSCAREPAGPARS